MADAPTNGAPFGNRKAFLLLMHLEHWTTDASLVETCRLNDDDPLAHLSDATQDRQRHWNSQSMATAMRI
jgi:hypothetical protein